MPHAALTAQDGNTWAVTNYAGGGGCGFSSGSYHATQTTNFHNFAFQVQMMVLTGANADGGGLLFRSGSSGFYRLRIGVNGTYDLAGPVSPVNGTSHAIKTGVN